MSCSSQPPAVNKSITKTLIQVQYTPNNYSYLFTMNSQLYSLNSYASVPTPPGMIAASMMKMNVSFEDSSFDASSFASHTSLSSSYDSYASHESASSFISSSKVGGLSRSRCMSNLSALGGNASETSIPRQTSYKSGPNQGWGYFVDTPCT